MEARNVKRCTKCNRVQSILQYGASKTFPKGIYTQCHACRKGYEVPEELIKPWKSQKKKRKGGLPTYKQLVLELGIHREQIRKNRNNHELKYSDGVEKWCRNCRAVKSVYEFRKRKGSKDGLDIHCKTCRSDAAFKKSQKEMFEEYDKVVEKRGKWELR